MQTKSTAEVDCNCDETPRFWGGLQLVVVAQRWEYDDCSVFVFPFLRDRLFNFADTLSDSYSTTVRRHILPRGLPNREQCAWILPAQYLEEIVHRRVDSHEVMQIIIWKVCHEMDWSEKSREFLKIKAHQENMSVR